MIVDLTPWIVIEPILVYLVVDDLTNIIQNEVAWCMFVEKLF